MAVDAFIRFWPADGSGMAVPKGESQDPIFDQFFEVKDFSLSVENKSTIGSATSGAGGGKVQFNEFTIKKITDFASPLFFKNCCAGAHYGKVVLAMRKAGADPEGTGQPYLVYNFGTVFTTKIDWSGPGDEGPEESVTFTFGAMHITYKKQTKEGTMGETQEMGWNQMTNKAGFPTTPAQKSPWT